MGKNLTNKDNNPQVDGTQLEQLGEVIEKIERAKQQAAIEQIKAADKDNERQYQFALKKLEVSTKKWNKSFLAGAIATAVLGGAGLVLLFLDKTDIGIGLLTTTFAGVFGFIAGAGSCDNKD